MNITSTDAVFVAVFTAIATFIINLIIELARHKKIEAEACNIAADSAAKLINEATSDTAKFIDALVERINVLEQRLDLMREGYEREINELRNEISVLRIENAKLSASVDALMQVNAMLKKMLEYGAARGIFREDS